MFTREELESFRGKTVPDLIGGKCSLLFVGINPGLWTAATGTHFCHPTNRFYPALKRAGIIDWAPSTETGMTEDQRLEFVGSGLGITNLVARATVGASELSREELRAGRDRLERVVSDVAPRVIAVAGVTAYRTAFGEASATLGKQTTHLAGTELWIVPNPSGLNAHETTESLARWYLSAANAAGLRVSSPVQRSGTGEVAQP